jgi:hypothetical protein
MMQAKAVDAAADYVRRGRAHRGLTDADLAGAWVAAPVPDSALSAIPAMVTKRQVQETGI